MAALTEIADLGYCLFLKVGFRNASNIRLLTLASKYITRTI